MKIWITITVKFDDQEPATRDLEFGGLKEGAGVIDCPQAPILAAIRQLSSCRAVRKYSVELAGSSLAD
jgi:hypothetical protein